MARSKRQMVEIFYDEYAAEKSFSEPRVKFFNECWNQIPDALIRKLSAKELWEYIRLHILPRITTVFRHTTALKYSDMNKKKNTMEHYA